MSSHRSSTSLRCWSSSGDFSSQPITARMPWPCRASESCRPSRVFAMNSESSPLADMWPPPTSPSASAAIAVVISLAGYWLVGPLIDFIGQRMTLGATALMIATLIFFKALEQIAGSLLFRREAYLQYSVLRVMQALLLLAGFSFAARAGATAGGLLLATLASYVAFALGGFVIAARYGSFRGVRLARMRSVLRSNQDFLKYSTPQTLDRQRPGARHQLRAGGLCRRRHSRLLQLHAEGDQGAACLLFAALSQVLFRFCATNRDDPQRVASVLLRTHRYVAAGLVAALLAVFLVRKSLNSCHWPITGPGFETTSSRSPCGC